jgi:hypothetical protein
MKRAAIFFFSSFLSFFPSSMMQAQEKSSPDTPVTKEEHKQAPKKDQKKEEAKESPKKEEEKNRG